MILYTECCRDRILTVYIGQGMPEKKGRPLKKISVNSVVCVRAWMIAGRLIENPTYHQTVKAYEGVRIFLFNGQRLETLRRSSSRKKKEKATEEADDLPSMNPADSNPIVEDIEAAKATTITLPESAVSVTGNTPILENDNE